jgi:hypothetical protein
MRILICAAILLSGSIAQAQFGTPKYLTPWGMWVRPVNTNLAAVTIEQVAGANTNDLQIVSNGIVTLSVKSGILTIPNIASVGNLSAGTMTNRASAGGKLQITDANGKLIDATVGGPVIDGHNYFDERANDWWWRRYIQRQPIRQ